MDLDNITDIEVLRSTLKKHMVKVKKDFYSEDGTMYIFKANYWYNVKQDEDYITIYSDDGESYRMFSYEEADEYLYKVSDE